MLKRALTILVCSFFFSLFLPTVRAQDRSGEKDTFFLVKKKGLLGRLGRSISTDEENTALIETVNPYRIHEGKSVNSIRIVSLGFERNLQDTTVIKRSIGVIIANAFHKNTREKVIYNNLFFREGSPVNSYLLADNERHLREQTFIQDARILLVPVEGSTDLVDVVVITKDVFSIGGTVNVSGVDRVRLGVREENIGGTGSKLSLSTLYEKNRRPNFGYGAEFINRNIGGSFINLKMGFQNYRNAFNSGRREETYVYAQLEKPLVSQYMRWIGSFEISQNKTSNAYIKDSLYQSDFQYNYVNTDAWIGYNFGKNGLLPGGKTGRLRKLVAVRSMYQKFDKMPERNAFIYDYRFVNTTGVLMSFNLFKQNFYKTSFIYGFGRNEDVPEGFTAAVIGGWTETNKRSRPYYGLDLQHTNFNKKGFFSSYTFRLGGYDYKGKMEDFDILANIEHFTRLRKLNTQWLNRNFYSVGFTRQINPLMNQPLFLRSVFGIPYHWNGQINADMRGTIRGETVFFNMNKFWGFRMAPFMFADLCVIKPSNLSYQKSELYSAFGAGIRTRNENLVFGTIELKGYYFPRPLENMRGFKIEVSSNIRFKYNSFFVRKPDFVVPN
ncbi:MAG: hypothetical protein V4725_00290 [Bacteroidota bacterium]